MIELGKPAPELSALDTHGRPVSLGDYRGHSAVLIYFMRTTTCPMCNSHVRDLASHAVEFDEQDVAVLIAVPEDRQEAAVWAETKSVPYPVLTGGEPHHEFGLARRMIGSMLQSGTVILDRHAIVRYVDIVTIPAGGYSYRAVTRALAGLHIDATA